MRGLQVDRKEKVLERVDGEVRRKAEDQEEPAERTSRRWDEGARLVGSCRAKSRRTSTALDSIAKGCDCLANRSSPKLSLARSSYPGSPTASTGRGTAAKSSILVAEVGAVQSEQTEVVTSARRRLVGPPAATMKDPPSLDEVQERKRRKRGDHETHLSSEAGRSVI